MTLADRARKVAGSLFLAEKENKGFLNMKV